MILRYERLSNHPSVFLSMTGLYVSEFDQLIEEVQPEYEAAETARLTRPGRQRAIGGGHPFEMEQRDHILLTVVWLRVYATHEVLGYLFGISDSTVSRLIRRVLPVLQKDGRDRMRMPDPGRKRRRQLDDLLRETPELAVVIDSFEQRVQRPQDREQADRYYSGKKKQHTLKSQVAVDEETGRIVDVADSVVGPTADIKLLEQSGLMARLPPGVGGIGDMAYQSIAKLHPQGLGASPRKKPRGQVRSPEDIRFNRAFSSRRIIVENTIGRMRRYQSITQMDRNHRLDHAARVVAIAGLVNRQFDSRFVH